MSEELCECGRPMDKALICACYDDEPTDADLYPESAHYFAALEDEPGSLGENDHRL